LIAKAAAANDYAFALPTYPSQPSVWCIEATQPGQKVQLDCFYVGRLSRTKGTVW
jgi:hypothetical protein